MIFIPFFQGSETEVRPSLYGQEASVEKRTRDLLNEVEAAHNTAPYSPEEQAAYQEIIQLSKVVTKRSLSPITEGRLRAICGEYLANYGPK